MATYTKNFLSHSRHGTQILITGSGMSTLTPIHTGVASTVDIDEVWIYANSLHTGSLDFYTTWGGITSGDINVISIPPKGGRVLVTDGKLIRNSLVISGYATISGQIVIDGFVNSIVN